VKYPEYLIWSEKYRRRPATDGRRFKSCFYKSKYDETEEKKELIFSISLSVMFDELFYRQERKSSREGLCSDPVIQQEKQTIIFDIVNDATYLQQNSQT
jgi:hypothetical protein